MTGRVGATQNLYTHSVFTAAAPNLPGTDFAEEA